MPPFPHDDVRSFLDEVRTGALATVGPQAEPYVCNVQFVRLQGLELVWASKPSAVHSTNLARQPRVALAVYGHPDTDPAGLHGAQLRGRAEAVALCPELWEPYTSRFPIAAGMRAAFDAGDQQLYRFRPDWVRWIDNRRRFGFKVEHHCT